MRRLRPFAILLLLAGLFAVPAHAQQTIAGRSVVEAAEKLKPGEFIWIPEIAPEGPVLLIVSTATQRAVLYRNGVPIAVTTVSTGRPGYRTPSGVFTVLEKQVQHFSTIYDGAPMPYMQRLTWRGVALHGGQLPGYPASHGCIRLPQEFARLLFGATHLGMTVIVTDAAAAPRLAPSRDPLPEGGAGGNEEPRWTPERQPSGPLSIVVSAADRRLVVLRNGREIGRAPVELAGTVAGTRAYVLRIEGEARRWSRITLPGEDLPEAAEAQDLGWEAIRVATAFRDQLVQALVPGTTVVLTSDSLKAGAAPVALLEEAPKR